jgi:hypothetical protein
MTLSLRRLQTGARTRAWPNKSEWGRYRRTTVKEDRTKARTGAVSNREYASPRSAGPQPKAGRTDTLLRRPAAEYVGNLVVLWGSARSSVPCLTLVKHHWKPSRIGLALLQVIALHTPARHRFARAAHQPSQSTLAARPRCVLTTPLPHQNAPSSVCSARKDRCGCIRFMRRQETLLGSRRSRCTFFVEPR